MAARLDSNETGGVTPSQFLTLYRELRAARRPMETAVGAYRAVLARVKNSGVDMDALRILESLAKLDEDEAGMRVRNLFKYASWTDMPLGAQADLFGAADQQPDDEATEKFKEQLASEEGHKVGLAGNKADLNPNAPGTASHAAWVRGWHEGQAAKVHGAFGAKPGRPAGSARRGRNPAASTNPAPESDAGAVQGGTRAEGDNPQPAGNVLPMRRRTAAKPVTVEARKKRDRQAARAVDALTGEPTVADSKPAF